MDAFDREREAVEGVGGRLVLTEEETFSASALLNRHFPIIDDRLRRFLDDVLDRHTPENVLHWIQAIEPLKVLLVGETIIDEYQYCETMGKSGKEPTLAARYVRTETSAGGVLAAANHLADFCGNVHLVSYLGNRDSHRDLIDEQLSPQVQATFLTVPGVPTIVKRRFVEVYPLQKLFEIYVMEDELPACFHEDLYEELAAQLPDYDAVMVTDYGHGMIEPRLIELLSEKAAFLAVNTQKNAGNHGFNTITKYPRADFVCISENELRLDARQRGGPLADLVRDAAERLGCRQMIVTCGQDGCLCYERGRGTTAVPALTTTVRDRVGAGDAMFVIAAACAVQQTPMDIVGLIGNAVGAQAVGIVGNTESIGRSSLLRHLDHLLK